MSASFEGTIDLEGHPTWMKDWGGDGPVVLLLHGGFVGTDTNFEPLVPHLEGNGRRLVGFDRRGHGRTADTAEPFSYATMANETEAMIERLDVSSVSAVGYSDGGNLLLDLAQRRPDLLDSMVLIGANYHHDALLPAALDTFEHLVDDELLRGLYAEQSPDGDGHWSVIANKGMQMARSQPTFTIDDLRAIEVPTLVIAGDDDLCLLAHTCSMFEALSNAQLAIVPGASHMCGWEQPEFVAGLITAFVQNPSASRMMPVQRG